MKGEHWIIVLGIILDCLLIWWLFRRYDVVPDFFEDWVKSFQEIYPDEEPHSWGIINIIIKVKL